MARKVPRRYGVRRFRRRRPTASLPLHRVQHDDDLDNDFSEIPPPRPRGLRTIALIIIAAIPVIVGAWALSIIVPVVIEARNAMDDVFVPTAERAHFDEATFVEPAIPGGEGAVVSTPAASPSLQPELTTTIPPTWTPAPTATKTTPTISATTTTNQSRRAATRTPTVAPPTSTPYPAWDGSDPVHILLLGVDSRPSENFPPRSDTIIVVRIDPEAKRVDMFSIPRDLLVAIPYFSDGTKINAAYPWGEGSTIEGGGPSLVAQTIELNFGIRIDYFASVSIAGLEDIVDTIGGVNIDVPAPLKDDQYPTYDYGYTRAFFPTGLQQMNGVQAVQYARTRHADGDFRRTERQQQLLLAMREQILQGGIITRLPELISDIGDTLRTDLSPGQVLSLARLAQHIPRENIYSHSLAPYTYAQIIDEGWYLIGDWSLLRWLAQNLPDDPDATNVPGD